VPKISVNGVDLNYVDRGRGDVLLLIHNVVANITTFEQNIAMLEKHFRVIACDLRGHGETTHHNDEEGAREFYTFDNIAEDITQLLAHLKVDRFSILGQAYWGVSTAAHVFARHADKVDGIVFASCDLLATDEGAEPFTVLGDKAVVNFRKMISLAREKGMMGVYEERLSSNTFWGPTVLNSPEILQRFEVMHRNTSAAAFANFPHFSKAKLAEILAKIEQHKPAVMMLMGVEDSHNDPMMANMRRMIPDIHIAILPYCGHYLAIENPQDFNAAVYNFMSGALRRRSS